MGHYDSQGNYVFGVAPAPPQKPRKKTPGQLKDEAQAQETYWESRDNLDRQLQGKKPKAKRPVQPKQPKQKQGLSDSEAIDRIDGIMKRW